MASPLSLLFMVHLFTEFHDGKLLMWLSHFDIFLEEFLSRIFCHLRPDFSGIKFISYHVENQPRPG